jgi:ankyrin repeat protein
MGMQTCPPIIEAVMLGNTRQVQRLLEHAAAKAAAQKQQQQQDDDDADDDDAINAIMNVDTMLVNTMDDFQCTPLIWACTTGDHVETVQLLLQYGAQVNHQEHLGQTALWRASLCGHYQVCQLLLQEPYCADATIADVNGIVPSQVADGKCQFIDWQSFMTKKQNQPQEQEEQEQETAVIVATSEDTTTTTGATTLSLKHNAGGTDDADDDDSSTTTPSVVAESEATVAAADADIDMIQQSILQLQQEMQQHEVSMLSLYQDHCTTRQRLECLLLENALLKKTDDAAVSSSSSISSLNTARLLLQDENEMLRHALVESQDERKAFQDKIQRFLTMLLL